jgi:hypothetical protein
MYRKKTVKLSVRFRIGTTTLCCDWHSTGLYLPPTLIPDFLILNWTASSSSLRMAVDVSNEKFLNSTVHTILIKNHFKKSVESLL